VNDYGPSVGARLVSALLTLIFAAIVLSIVVDILKAIWPWLVGFGLLLVTGYVVLLRIRQRNTSW